jgi:hypothetical protein
MKFLFFHNLIITELHHTRSKVCVLSMDERGTSNHFQIQAIVISSFVLILTFNCLLPISSCTSLSLFNQSSTDLRYPTMKFTSIIIAVVAAASQISSTFAQPAAANADKGLSLTSGTAKINVIKNDFIAVGVPATTDNVDLAVKSQPVIVDGNGIGGPGSAVVSRGGTINYFPVNGFVGTVTFTYTITTKAPPVVVDETEEDCDGPCDDPEWPIKEEWLEEDCDGPCDDPEWPIKEEWLEEDCDGPCDEVEWTWDEEFPKGDCDGPCDVHGDLDHSGGVDMGYDMDPVVDFVPVVLTGTVTVTVTAETLFIPVPNQVSNFGADQIIIDGIFQATAATAGSLTPGTLGMVIGTTRGGVANFAENTSLANSARINNAVITTFGLRGGA